jgi:hypothetical protein
MTILLGTSSSPLRSYPVCSLSTCNNKHEQNRATRGKNIRDATTSMPIGRIFFRSLMKPLQPMFLRHKVGGWRWRWSQEVTNIILRSFLLCFRLIIKISKIKYNQYNIFLTRMSIGKCSCVAAALGESVRPLTHHGRVLPDLVGFAIFGG